MKEITFEQAYNVLARHLGCKPHEVSLIMPTPYVRIHFDNMSGKFETGNGLRQFLANKMPDMNRNVVASNKIQLIKHFREFTNSGLAYGKNVVENWGDFLEMCEEHNRLPDFFMGAWGDITNH